MLALDKQVQHLCADMNKAKLHPSPHRGKLFMCLMRVLVIKFTLIPASPPPPPSPGQENSTQNTGMDQNVKGYHQRLRVCVCVCVSSQVIGSHLIGSSV